MASDKDNSRKRLTVLASRLNGSSDYFRKQISTKIKADRDNSTARVIEPLSLYADAVFGLMKNDDIESAGFIEALEYGKAIYRSMFPFGEGTPDFDKLALVFAGFFVTGGVVSRRCFDITFFNLFSDPSNYIKWLRCLSTPRNFNDYREPLFRYGVEARSLYPDEDMFTANIIMVTDRMMHALNPEDVYAEEVKRVEHMAGIYDVDEALIYNAEQQINAAKDVVNRSHDVLREADAKMNTLSSLADAAATRIKSICENEISFAETRIETIDAQLKQAYNAFLDTQQKKLAFEKQQLIDSVISESEVKLAELRKTASQLISTAKLELANINRESGIAAQKIESIIKDDERIKTLLAESAEREALMSKIDKLMVLNDKNIDTIVEGAEQISAVVSADPQPAQGTGRKGVKSKVSVVAAPAQTVTAPGFVSAEPLPEDIDPELIPAVNPLFDEAISFKERFAYAIRAKKRMAEEEGAHFHKMFDDVLMAVMENANPYLIGPSGCGKTYMIGQISKILNVDFIDIGYINEEYDILGFQTANGGYSRPNFYRCYKYGKIAFCDELDNGNSRATVKLNSFLSNTEDAYYNFPNGERVSRHKNFRIIGAGNTAGNGADSIYNTRERIEESVQQRFTPIYIGYDNEVERAILGDNKDWFRFVELFRAATDAWSRSSHTEAPGIITTRDVTGIRRYIDNESFSMEKILDYEFIQTKDESYLAFLSKFVSDNLESRSPAELIAKTFIKKVDDLRSGRTTRY